MYTHRFCTFDSINTCTTSKLEVVYALSNFLLNLDLNGSKKAESKFIYTSHCFGRENSISIPFFHMISCQYRICGE